MSRSHSRMPARMVRWLLAIACALALLPWRGPTPAAAATCVVTSTDDAPPFSTGTLRAAVGDPNCATITFDLPGPGPWVIGLAFGLALTDHDVALIGPGRDLLTIDGRDLDIPLFANAIAASVEGLTIAHGHAEISPGAGMRIIGGTVALRHARLRDNRATGTMTGGGLYVGGGTVTLDDVEVLDNIAGADANGVGGGGIFVDQTYGSTDLQIRNSAIRGNSATGRGGGILAVRWGGQASPKTLRLGIGDSAIAENASSSGGGGIYSWQAALTMTGSGVRGNATTSPPLSNETYSGGGIRLNGGTATIDGSTLAGNSVSDKGGGLYAWSATLLVQNSTITDNAAVYGGGINVGDSNLAVFNSTISGNRGISGAGLLASGGLTSLTAVTVVQNRADADGGGIVASGTGGVGGPVLLRQSLVAGNWAGVAASDCAANGPGTAPLTSGGDNVVSAGGGCPADRPGDLAYAGDFEALVAPALADNGGPTRTHTLPPGSPAIDRATDGCAVAQDQRYYPRPQGGACDSGAVEATAALDLHVAGEGQIRLDPPGSSTGGGWFTYAPGTTVTLTPQPASGQVFIGWTIDGLAIGWPAPLPLVLDADHSVRATFAPEVTFPDVPGGRADRDAIVALATRGLIRGYRNGNYGPDDTVTRAQMAALIARATPSGGPPGHALAPPACTVAGSWDCEDWGNRFVDRGGLDGGLWRDIGVLQHYGVASGLDGVHFGPNDPVTYAQTISFITRAMKAKGYWTAQPAAPLPYAGVPAAHADDIRTFAYYTHGRGGVPTPPADWNGAATRGWFARALWAALDAYWGSVPAGGTIPIP